MTKIYLPLFASRRYSVWDIVNWLEEHVGNQYEYNAGLGERRGHGWVHYRTTTATVVAFEDERMATLFALRWM